MSLPLAKSSYLWVFMGGKQVRITYSSQIGGMGVVEYIKGSADDIWLHQMEVWEVRCERNLD
ncbi:hypothetical protein MO867_14755 [Microbulbifer sp. OS29]|uniref:Uncharacterized protein n=1 Tax=Microbulbifer okhotskensis TaxID=2926617 RepID=A0A9X2J8I9_9GAMM|nr:hypothetical protein [Microbulbifer okhotskensis]MCO1335596.1 hypothetical protein [Microbulbifer okhotskensis]